MSDARAALCHLTWQSSDADRTRDFLARLFDWSFESRGDNYWTMAPPSGAWVGLTQVDAVRPGNAFLPQIAVADLADLKRRAAVLGGEVMVGEGEIPGLGRYLDLRDPDGTLFSAIQFDASSGRGDD